MKDKKKKPFVEKKWRMRWTRGSGFNLGAELSDGGNSSGGEGSNNSDSSINQTHETTEDTTTTHNHRSTQASIDQTQR